MFASTLIHPDPIVIPEILKILRDEFSHLKHHEMPFCTNAQPLHFELDVIDELSVSTKYTYIVFCFHEFFPFFNVNGNSLNLLFSQLFAEMF